MKLPFSMMEIPRVWQGCSAPDGVWAGTGSPPFPRPTLVFRLAGSVPSVGPGAYRVPVPISAC